MNRPNPQWMNVHLPSVDVTPASPPMAMSRYSYQSFFRKIINAKAKLDEGDCGRLWRRLLQEFQDLVLSCSHQLLCCHGHQIAIAIGLDP